MCGSDCVWSHTALCLYFDVLLVSGAARDESGFGGGAFPPANDSTGEVESTATGCCSGWRKLGIQTAVKERKYSPMR